MDSNSWRAKGPSELRNDGGMLSGSAFPLPFIFLMADNYDPFEVEHSFHSNRWCIDTFPESPIDVAIGM